ncbi:hypothetical protein E8K88_02545 [Lampropedia aestuarii]|uniref:Uncharacterized protein n=1 Tax=Lampropedia aestuarii TaxID=2562762 RepID=A0A4S5BXK1_9BURK|nr:hypothetical protein [Lampropedia aestuarii]THJ36163.1 hypothetical protein E8K88_02545 [Lampropedia aestuarii]
MQSTIELSQVLTEELRGKVIESIIVGEFGAFSIRAKDGTVATLNASMRHDIKVSHGGLSKALVNVDAHDCADCIPVANSDLTPESFRPKLPPMLADLLLQPELPLSDSMAESEQAQEVRDKPPAQMVSIPSGIDATAVFGMTRRAGGIDWEKVVTLPTFQMYVAESKFPNPNDLDSQKLAISFVQSAISSGKDEQQFYEEYALWFDQKACWHHESPMGVEKNG